MNIRKLKKELEGDIRNKITFPKAILECILSSEKNIKKSDIRKALKSLNKIPALVDKWVKKIDKDE